MSKKLKEQWEDEIVAEIPDLWSRIEANLPGKNHSLSDDVHLSEEKNAVFHSSKEKEEATQPFIMKEGAVPVKKRIAMKRIMPVLIAAAALFIIVFPVFLLPAGLRIVFGGNKTTADFATNDIMENAKEESAGDSFYEEGNDALETLPGEGTNDAEYSYSKQENSGAACEEDINADCQTEGCNEAGEAICLISGVIVFMEEAVQSGEKTIWSVRLTEDVQGEEPFGTHAAGESLFVTISQDTKEIPQEGKEYRVSFLFNETDSEYFEICVE